MTGGMCDRVRSACCWVVRKAPHIRRRALFCAVSIILRRPFWRLSSWNQMIEAYERSGKAQVR